MNIPKLIKRGILPDPEADAPVAESLVSKAKKVLTKATKKAKKGS